MAVSINHRITGYTVLNPDQKNKPTPDQTSDADRRLILAKVEAPLANTLRWASRPDQSEGHPSWTFRVPCPEGKFTLTVVHTQNGTPLTGEPFEVWVNDGAPRGLKALCKSLSMDLRSNDRLWVKTKLESITKTRGTPFDLDMPGGRKIRCRGAVSAFAHLILHRCESLGTFSQEHMGKTQLMDALMSKREPKATATGTMGWMVPISQTGYPDDDFEMVVKEVARGDRIIPQSIWLSGNYPDSLDGLCKSLSFDLRVNDVHWPVLKLQQLLDLEEPRGEFWASDPGTGKSACFPSLVSYMATLVLYRMQVLGLIDQNQQPTCSTGGVTLHVVPATTPPTLTEQGINGELCPQCDTYAVRRLDGKCGTCVSCGFSECA